VSEARASCPTVFHADINTYCNLPFPDPKLLQKRYQEKHADQMKLGKLIGADTKDADKLPEEYYARRMLPEASARKWGVGAMVVLCVVSSGIKIPLDP
jgi:hypothetical protein